MCNHSTSGNDVGKDINVSFPFHKLHLIKYLAGSPYGFQ